MQFMNLQNKKELNKRDAAICISANDEQHLILQIDKVQLLEMVDMKICNGQFVDKTIIHSFVLYNIAGE